MTLSVVLITLNEEANIRQTLESVRALADEIILVDAGSSDGTAAIAHEMGARVFVEPWKGYAAQKNSALDKATCDWVLSLDADEVVSTELAAEIRGALQPEGSEARERARSAPAGYWIPRRNFFLGRWVRHGGFYPDPKLRLFRRGAAKFEDRLVHEDAQVEGPTAELKNALLHYAYPTLDSYIEHMNRYSSLGAEMAAAKGGRGFSLSNILLRPAATFVYNYFFRLGFLDGREGLLLHLYHSVYVSWKYAKRWERSRKSGGLLAG